MKILQLVSVMLFALVSGVFWGTWFSLSRSIALISPSTFLEVGHTMIRNLGGPMRLLMPAAVLANLAVVVLLFRQKQREAFALASAALFLLVLALVVTLAVNVPIDDEIRQWTVATLPADWQSTRDRWQFYHSVRTFASLVGLGCAFASALWNRPIPG
jgi:uncharacterized membrane protein